MPAFGPHDVRHLGVQERDLRERAPGPTEVGPDIGCLTADRAAGEDEAERLLLGRRGRRDVAVLANEDRAALEEGGRGSEDEVHVAGDRAALEVLTAAVQEHGVLPARETAVAEDGAVAVDAERERLPDGAGGVLEAELLRREVVRIDHGGRRPEGPDRLAVGALRVHVEVEADHGRLRVLADERQEPLLALDEDPLPVDTRPDVDDPAPVGATRGCGRDCGLQRLELATTVGGDDRVRIRQPAGRSGERQRRGESECDDQGGRLDTRGGESEPGRQGSLHGRSVGAGARPVKRWSDHYSSASRRIRARNPIASMESLSWSDLIAPRGAVVARPISAPAARQSARGTDHCS